MKLFLQTPTRLAASHRASTRSGFTLIEVVVATVILVVAMGGAVSAITSTAVLGESNRESAVAYQAARGVMETLQAASFQQLIILYNDDPADDPDGAGTAPGSSFAVPGLDVQAGDADGLPGRIVLPLSADGTLRETLVDPSFEMPRDLSGNGVVDGLDHSTDFILMPVRVRVEWRGGSGDRFVEYATTLSLRRR